MKNIRRKTFFGFAAAIFLMGIILVLAGCGLGASEQRMGGGIRQGEGAANQGAEFDQGAEDSGGDTEGIVNGTGKLTAVSKTLAKSVVAIVSESSQGQALCTGSIISKDIVLTAAHCVEGNPDRMVIVFKPNLKRAGDADKRSVRKFTQHPDWKKSSVEGRGDLALLQFAGGLPKGFTPLHLASGDLVLSIGENVGMLGYGVVNGTTEKGAGVLRKTNTKVLKLLNETEVMTDGKSTSVCFGDSGGPAFVKREGKWVQWGVASAVMTHTCDKASIHTSVMSNLSWINEASSSLRK